MFGLFRRKDSQPPPFRPASPFLNDGNPIHQAIIGLKKGDTTQTARLFDALISTPVLILMDNPNDWKTCGSLEWKGEPCICIFTQRDLIPQEQLDRYAHVVEVKVPKILDAVRIDAMGLLINAGHPEVGAPMAARYVKVFRDTMDDLHPLRSESSASTSSGEDDSAQINFPADDDVVHQLMSKIGNGDETQVRAFFELLAECVVVVPLKEPGRLESALVIRVKEVPYIVLFTRPEFVDLAPAAKDYPYRAQMKVRQLFSHLVTDRPVFVLNPKHPQFSLPIIPRLFKDLRSHVASLPPPFVPPAPPPKVAPDSDRLHQAIRGVKSGDKAQLFRLFDALATTPVYLTLAKPGKWDTCGAILIEGDTCLVIFTRLEHIRPDHLASHPHIVQNLLHQVLAEARGSSLGVTINQGNADVGLSLPPAAVKVFFDAVVAGSPTPVLGGLYDVRNEDGTFSVLKILKLDEGGVHIRQYSNPFPAPPLSVDESKLYMVGPDRTPTEKLGMGHLPISKNSFAGWGASFVQQSTVTDEELDGYKMWLEAKGGYF